MPTYAMIRHDQDRQIKTSREDGFWFSLKRDGNQYQYIDSAGQQRPISDIRAVGSETLMAPLRIKRRAAFEPEQRSRSDLHRIFSNGQGLFGKPKTPEKHFGPITARTLNPENP